MEEQNSQNTISKVLQGGLTRQEKKRLELALARFKEGLSQEKLSNWRSMMPLYRDQIWVMAIIEDWLRIPHREFIIKMKNYIDRSLRKADTTAPTD